jgi:sigma-54 specific flagellar transcriptional regulator A
VQESDERASSPPADRVSTSRPGARSPEPGAQLDYFQLARDRGIGLKDLRHEVEMQCIARALAEANGNISEAARLLQMKRSRLSQIVNAEPSLKEVARGED